MADTIGRLSETIMTQYLKQTQNDKSPWSLRHIAEQVATEIAVQAWASAIEAEKLGETLYANDMFITPFTGLDLLTMTDGRKYVPMPNTPAGLPQQREVAYVGFTGNSKTQVFPLRQKDRFMQQMLPTPAWMIQYYVEGNNILFDNLGSNIKGPVDIRLVGALPVGDNILDLPINATKQAQSIILDKILSRMLALRNALPDLINDNVAK